MSRLFAGDRRVWRVAGAVTALAVAGVLVALALPRDYYVGTNNIALQSYVAAVKDGEELCVPDLQVPKGTGRVRVKVLWDGTRGPAFEGRLAVAGKSYRGRIPPHTARSPGNGANVDVPVPEPRLPGEAAPGRYCLRPVGAGVQMAGKKELQGRHPLPTIAGHALQAEVAVWFLPPEGHGSSALSLLPQAFERAALFRPGIVGAWTYWLLLFVVAPLSWLASIRLLATRAAGLGGPGRTALAVGLVAFAVAGTWALLTPPFDAPDEPDHYSYVQTLAETGNAPEKVPGDRPAYSNRLAASLESIRLYARVQSRDERPPWLAGDERRTERRLATPPNRSDDGGGYLVSTSVHTPLYYGLLAPAYLAGGSDPFTQLALMRLVSALLGALTAALCFLTVRELFPRRPWLAVAAGLLVAYQPMFTFIAGAANNDSGVNAAAALLVYLLVRGLRRGVSVPLGLGIGATLVVLPLMKGTGYGLYAAALVALVGMVWRRHRVRDLPGYGALACAAVAFYAGWSALSSTFDRTSFTTPGGVAPTASNGVIGNVLAHPLTYANYVWQVFLPRIPGTKDVALKRWPAFDIYVERGWAAFGWYAMQFPKWVYVVIALAMLAAGALCALALVRERLAARARGWELAVLLVAIVGIVAGVEAAYFTDQPRSVVSEQGRYAFTAIVPLATVAVGAACAFGRRRAPLVAAGLAAGMMGFAFAAQMLAVTKFFM